MHYKLGAAAAAAPASEDEFFLASFHGDTNGLATIPVVEAVRVHSYPRMDPRARTHARTHAPRML